MKFTDELIGRIVNTSSEERKALLEIAHLEDDEILKKICSIGEDFTIVDLLTSLSRDEYVHCLEMANKCVAMGIIEDMKRKGDTRHVGVFSKFTR